MGMGLEGSGPALTEVAFQYLYLRKEESEDKDLHKTGDVLTEILTGDLPNKRSKKFIFISTSPDNFSEHSA
jgi:hypothetical protein